MEPLRVNRRLTCILAADAVGFSAMMAADEAGTIRILSAHRAVIDGIIAFHEGRIISTAGDSVLAEFGSAVEAVRCATEMQEALKTRNEALPEDHRLYFRIGINLGDVVVKGNDLLGDGVNVAARLEGIADPGGVCIASSVYDQITGKLDLGFVDIGEQSLKNISRPIHVYRIDGTGMPARAVQGTPLVARNRVWYVVGGALAGLTLLAVAWMGGNFGGTTPTASRDKGQAAAEDAKRLADAAAIDAKRKAKSEADLVRARAEVDAAAIRAKAAADAAALRAKVETDAAKARTPTVQPPASPTARSVASLSPPGSPRATPSKPNAYDGQWVATFACVAIREIPAGTFSSRVTVRDGEFVVEPRVRGQQGYWHVSGRPGSDGNLVLAGSYIARTSAEVAQQGAARFDGRLVGDRFVLGGRFGPRDCTVSMARAGH